ncbi:MAG: hypothetical protein WBP81_24830, partial [Solirubrobacteraceae bacterium]
MDEPEKPVVGLGGLLLGQQSSHQRAAELTADIGVIQQRALFPTPRCCIQVSTAVRADDLFRHGVGVRPTSASATIQRCGVATDRIGRGTS